MILVNRTEDGAVQINELDEGVRFYLDVEDHRITITFGDKFRNHVVSITSTVIGVTGTNKEFPSENLFFYNALRFVETYMVEKLIEHLYDEEGDFLDLDAMMLFLNLDLEAMEEDWEMEHAEIEENESEVE